MHRVARTLTTVALCAALGVAGGAAARAQIKPVARSPASDEPSVVSVLRMAVDIAEGAHHEAMRLPLRYRVAVTIKKTRQELSFGSFVGDSISFWDQWDPTRSWIDRELDRRHAAIEAEAKRALLSGDKERAKDLLGQRMCKPPLLTCKHVNADRLLLQWEIQSGDLEGAAHRLATTDWMSGYGTADATHEVARAYLDAGERRKALALIAGLSALPGINERMIAAEYWRLDAREEAKAALRRHVASELDAAARDQNKRLPGEVPAMQWAMDDRDGANETLRRLQAFDKSRVAPVRAPIAGFLALTGRDSEADALLENNTGDAATLAYIVAGQARRGDFDAAFGTLEKLRALATPTMIDGSSLAPPVFDDNFSSPGPVVAVATIERLAARAGNVEAFEKADAIRRDMNPPDTPRWAITMAYRTVLPPKDRIYSSKFTTNNASTPVLADLARTGHAKLAVEYALLADARVDKIDGLCAVAIGLAGVPSPTSSPFGFFESW